MALSECTLKIGTDADTLTPVLRELRYSQSLDLLDALFAEVRFSLAHPKAAAIFKLCVAGAAFELGFGARTIKGDITRVDYQYFGGSEVLLTLHGLEPLHRLRYLQFADEALGLKKKNEIVEAIIKKAGATGKATGVTEGARELLLLDSSALGMLKRLAAERNFALRESGGTIEFAARGTKGTADIKLPFDRVVDRLRITTDLEPVATSVEVHWYDYIKAAEDKYKAEEKDLAKVSGGDTAIALRKKAWAGKGATADQVRPIGLGVQSSTAAKEHAIGELQQRAERFLRGSVECSFDPVPQPADTVTLDGAPWPLTGPFRVSTVEQRFGPGHKATTFLEFFSDSLPKAS